METFANGAKVECADFILGSSAPQLWVAIKSLQHVWTLTMAELKKEKELKSVQTEESYGFWKDKKLV